MTPQRAFLSLSVPAVLAVALTACTGGGPGPDEGTAPDPGAQSGAGGTTTQCVTGNWNLDTTDTANQLLQYLIAKEAPVIDSRADGAVVLHIGSDGTMTYTSGVTYDFTADAGGAGLEVMQSQIGDASGDWGWGDNANTVMTFTGWTSTVAINNSAQIGGSAVNFPLELPPDGPGSVPLTVTCGGDVLTTKADPSPFTLKWNRA
jgi:hypothetical protein